MVITKNDIDKIIDNQKLNDNTFIKFLKKKKINNNPNLDILFEYYKDQFFKNLLINFTITKFIIILLRIIQVLSIFFIVFGCLLPIKYLKFHIFFCLKSIILIEILNKYYISEIISRMSKKDKRFIPFDLDKIKNIILIFTFISFFNLIYPEFCLFDNLCKLTKKLSK